MKLAIILIVACLGYASARGMPGGWSSQEKASDKLIEIASWSSKHKDLGLLDIASGPITVTEISNIHTQIVSGINYKFTITVSFNDAQGQQVKKQCRVTVYDQPWTNTRQITSNQCL